MPLKLNVGLNRKVGEPNDGSRGANVNVEVEVDSALVNEPGRLQDRIRQLFGLVRSALVEELNGGGSVKHPENRLNGNGVPQGLGGQRLATAPQVRAILGLVRRQNVNLKELLRERFQAERLEDLPIKQASQLIDFLKQAEVANGA